MRIIANRYSDDNMDPQQAEEDSKVDAAKRKVNNKVKDTARKFLTDSKKRKQIIDIIKKIADLIVKFWPVFLVLLAIIVIIGFIAFISTMPGLMEEKFVQTGKSIFSKVHSFFTGETVNKYDISDEEVIGVAEYIQNMGYDISGYGFGDVTYKKDYEGETPPTSIGKTKSIEKITPYADKKNYIQSYIAAHESTYALAIWSVGGAWRAWSSNISNLLSGLFDSIKGDWTSAKYYQIENARDYSTGMINIDGLTGNELAVYPLGILSPWPFGGGIKFKRNGVDITAYAEIDRENAKLIIYNANTFVIHIPFFNVDLRHGGKGSFAYDIDEWLARYGRPTELFLALHLSTMMPDLTYEIATSEDFNTKVNLGINLVTVNYYVQWTDDSGREWKEQDLMDEFIDNLTYTPEIAREDAFPESYREGYEKIINKAKSDEEFKLQFYKSCVKSMEPNEKKYGHSSGSYRVNVVYGAYKAAKDLDDEDFANEIRESFYGDPEDMVTNYENVIGSRWNIKPYMAKGRREDSGIIGRIGDTIKGWIENLADVITDKTECGFINQRGEYEDLFGCWHTATVRNTLGIEDEKFKALHELQAEGVEGIEKVQFPYISSVTKHWYYKDFYFPASENGVYYKARTASKMIKFDYVKGEEERPLEGMDIMLDALLTAENGNAVYYQVREPYTEGPNDAIWDLFVNKKFYRYDGSPETARNIAIAKAAEGDGVAVFQGQSAYVTGDQKEWGELPEKQTASFGNKEDTLSAFSILEGVHTENSDWIYRRLKMLLLDLEVYSKKDIEEPLKNVLMWLIESDVDLPRYEPFNEKTIQWDVTKDINEYGLEIKDVEGQKVICPGDAEVVSASGDTITLRFKALSMDTYNFLKYEYSKRLFRIDRGIIEDYTMTIKGVDLTVSGGDIKRGDPIGIAQEKINVIMQRPDQSLVGQEGDANEDNIEDYMNQFYTNKHEQELKDRYDDRKEIATDRGGPNGGNSGGSYDPANPDNEDPDLQTEYPKPDPGSTEEQLEYVYAKVASEGGGSYESALAVISCAANRVDSSWYSQKTLYDILYANGQFVGNHSKFIKDGKYVGPTCVKQAVDDCINNGIRNHGFTSFRTSKPSTDAARKQKIKSSTGCSDSELHKYCREIGGNFYFNEFGKKDHYYEEYDF